MKIYHCYKHHFLCDIGLADCVLALGFEKMQRGSLTSQVNNSFFLLF
jgi:hypothetical protein